MGAPFCSIMASPVASMRVNFGRTFCVMKETIHQQPARHAAAKKKIFALINIGNREDAASQACNIVIVAAIFTNLVILILETFQLPPSLLLPLHAVEYITLVIFIIEYALRIYTAEYQFPGQPFHKAVLKFFFSFYGQIDLWSILPYFLPLFLPTGIVALRVLRIFRVLRLFQVSATSDAFSVMVDVLKAKRDQIVSSVVLIFIMMLASSLLMYSIEHNAQPGVFKNAFSGMWWAVSAIFTVGYGDIYPVTLLGQALAIVISFLGVGLVAIPTGIISAGFVEQYQKAKAMTIAAAESPMSYLEITLEHGHPWIGLKTAEVPLSGEFRILAILREDSVNVPLAETVLQEEDMLLVTSLEPQMDIGIRVRAVTIGPEHRWLGQKVGDIALPENVLLSAIVRKGRAREPRPNMILRLNDQVLLCGR